MTEATYSDAKMKLRREVLAILLKKYSHENVRARKSSYVQSELD